MRRESFFAGSFYPDGRDEVLNVFNIFEEAFLDKESLLDFSSRAVIVPHAGYVYSGFSASLAYRVLAYNNIKKTILIGPSHRYGFEGVSIGCFDSYKTPLGEIRGDGLLADNIRSLSPFYRFVEEAHKEHSTEVQFSFIKNYLKESTLLEVVYGKAEPKDIVPIVRYALEDSDCALIISTDLSHFYDEKVARSIDINCLDGIVNKDLELLKNSCEACGKVGVLALVAESKVRLITPKILDYRTSASASGDSSRVVGYLSVAYDTQLLAAPL